HRGRVPQSWPNWVERMLVDSRQFLDEVCDSLGVLAPLKLPRSTPTTVTFRYIREFLTHTVGRLDHWECRNGYCDTSGYGGGKREEWFARFPVDHTERPLGLPTEGELDSAYGYWFLLKNEEPAICLTTGGVLHAQDGRTYDLHLHYLKHKRIWPLIAETALEWLP
ncbi:MAG: hypothetical protein KDB14_28460, partial [Planctomycetales bacterium]|nr:hypothetical protein [Planctomycetales bacterium]